MLGSNDHYVLGTTRRFKLHARWDLRKVNKYLELHAIFGYTHAGSAKYDRTRTARIARINDRWAFLYVQASKDGATAKEIADGLESVLSFQAANPNREPHTSDAAARRERQVRDLTLTPAP